MKNFLFSLLMVLTGASFAFAGKDHYLLHNGLNWVKVLPAPKKVATLGALKHPFTGISPDKMEDMLLSIKISKKYLFKKDLQTTDVFNSWEVRKIAPYLVEGLARADPEQVVVFSVVHKRPIFLLRNDHLSVGYVWAADDGIHVMFDKLFAALGGDYEASSKRDKAARSARSFRVSLEANPGQQLVYDSPMEVILDPTHDFASDLREAARNEKLAEEEEMRGGSKIRLPSSSRASSAYSSGPSAENIAGRLRKLEQLKSEGYITEQEYRAMRQKILSEM